MTNYYPLFDICFFFAFSFFFLLSQCMGFYSLISHLSLTHSLTHSLSLIYMMSGFSESVFSTAEGRVNLLEERVSGAVSEGELPPGVRLVLISDTHSMHTCE
jgi:hypothetical protein